MVNCSSCGKMTNDFVEFKCPNCGNSKIVRCKQCKQNEISYTCKECSFEGP